MFEATGIETPALVVVAFMTLAAVIDGWKLKVPNWVTFPFVMSGWVFHLWASGLTGWCGSLLGTVVGLVLLLAPYAIGGMGAGDVKLFAGVGAWMGAAITLSAFVISAIVGGILAIAMIGFRAYRARDWSPFRKHAARFETIAVELLTTPNPVVLAERAAARKATALLLPYGIPLAIGTIGYFVWMGIL